MPGSPPFIQSLETWSRHILARPGDDEMTLALKVSFWLNSFFGTPIIFVTAGLLWWLGFPHYAQAMFFFACISVFFLLLLRYSRWHIEHFGFFVQIFMVLFSFGAGLYLGGILYSSGVVFVGLFGGLIALTYPNIRRARFVFGLYFLTIIISAALQPWLTPLPEMTPTANLWLFVGHILVVFVSYFIFIYNYINQSIEIEKEKAIQEKQLEDTSLLNARLQQIDKLKDQFLANTSHELRTPLQGIIGLSESMIEETDRPEHRTNLSMIISSGKRLKNLVNDLLDFSKLKHYDLELTRKPLNLHALTDILIKANAPLAKGKDVQLINAVPKDISAVYADEDRLQQILFNLVGNAIKFTERGYVRIMAEEKDDYIQVTVKDTGIGIPEHKREVIFREFEQGDGSTAREFAGTGLGLSISRRLVELHGGAMWVDSQVGQGSTFCFTLPKSTEAATSQPITEAMTTPSRKVEVTGQTETSLASIPSDQDLIRILVVDDEPINQQVFKNYLANPHIQVMQAMSGEEALEQLDQEPPVDLVLLDVMMPRMSGYEVCQKIREKYLPSELPVIMVTAKDQLQDIVQGLSFGANDYLPKPFHKEELLARINTQLDLHRIFDIAGRFVPNEFLRSLNRNRITEVTLDDYAEKQVTVLFSDIRDYTRLSETMTPEENYRFVKAFNQRMGPIIREHQGFVNQFLGDGLMAIFSQNPEDALNAAIAMQKRLSAYNQEREAKGRRSIKLGIGFHTGSLIMCIIGDQKRMDATTISDTVNTASRIENLTKYYGASILLTEDSYAAITDKGAYHFRYLGQVLVKGKKMPVGIYECFDGDAPAMREAKEETMAAFEEGIGQYQAQNFPEAVTAFNRVLKLNPEDQPARLFLSKSSQFIVQGVPEDWTGVEVMTFK